MEAIKILDTNAVIDGKDGIITVFTAIEYPPALETCDVLYPQNVDYDKALEIASALRDAGTPIGAVDILIAAMCINRNATLVSRDKDFDFVKRLFPLKAEFNGKIK